MSDPVAFTKKKLSWIERVACDARVTPLGLRIAVLLAARYLNSRSGTAWPAVETLATQLGTTRRSIQRACAQLADLGWIERELNAGRNHTNFYRIKGDVGVAFSADKRRRTRPVKGDVRVARTLERNPRITTKTSFSRFSSPNDCDEKKAFLFFPKEWKCGATEIAVGYSTAGWGADRAKKEFERFREWNVERSTRSADWSGLWNQWCVRGKELDSKATRAPDANSRAAKHDGVVAGLRKFMATQVSTEE